MMAFQREILFNFMINMKSNDKNQYHHHDQNQCQEFNWYDIFSLYKIIGRDLLLRSSDGVTLQYHRCLLTLRR